METDNYQKWRDILRTQLTNTSSLFFVFASATLGFTVAKLLDREKPLSAATIQQLAKSIQPIQFSLVFYTLFMLSRLADYFHTQYLFKSDAEGKVLSAEQVRKKTQFWFVFTWGFFAFQMLLLCKGVFCLREAIVLAISGE